MDGIQCVWTLPCVIFVIKNVESNLEKKMCPFVALQPSTYHLIFTWKRKELPLHRHRKPGGRWCVSGGEVMNVLYANRSFSRRVLSLACNVRVSSWLRLPPSEVVGIRKLSSFCCTIKQEKSYDSIYFHELQV